MAGKKRKLKAAAAADVEKEAAVDPVQILPGLPVVASAEGPKPRVTFILEKASLRIGKVGKALVRKKATDEIIKAAYLIDDHLDFYPPFRKYDRNGLSLYLESGTGDRLSSSMKSYIQMLLKVNMEGPFGHEWPMEEKLKHREMVAPEARYIFIREGLHANTSEALFPTDQHTSSIPWEGDKNRPVGFLHYRFVVEEEIPTIYVYELQLEPHVQGKGLGMFLMQLIELIGRKNQLGAAMLTVQKANVSAMNFYLHKLKYVLSSISPSRVDPLIGTEKSYEILCKTFNLDAKTKLENFLIKRIAQEALSLSDSVRSKLSLPLYEFKYKQS